MKIVKIDGELWNLTREQECYTVKETHLDSIGLPEINRQIIQCNTIYSNGSVRLLANEGVRSRAYAFIEIIVRGLPQQFKYVIYHDKKGFFCIVKSKKYYLKDLEWV